MWKRVKGKTNEEKDMLIFVGKAYLNIFQMQLEDKG